MCTAANALVAEEFVTWRVAQQRWSGHGRNRTRIVLVGAVDNYLARRELAQAVAEGDGQAHSESSGQVWAVDCGHARANGQVLVGNLTDLSQMTIDKLGVANGLPSPYIQEPGLLEPDSIDVNPLSCADLTLREEQSLLINAQIAAVAVQYLYDLTIPRTLWKYATYFNLEPPTMVSRVVTKSSLTSLMAPSVNSNVTV